MTEPSLRRPAIPNWGEADLSDKPDWLRLFFDPFTAEHEAYIDEFFRDRVRSMLSVDELIARVVQELDTLGELPNTYVIFTSDNGFIMGPHRFTRGKDAPYEESIRIPFAARGPGIRAASTSDAFILNNDFAPTLMELAGLPIPNSVDGRSIAPLLRGSTPGDWRKDFVIEHWSPDGGGIPDYAGLRTERHVYVEYVTGEREIYDLRSDPYQLTSLHATMPASTVAPLRNRLNELRGCRGQGCR